MILWGISDTGRGQDRRLAYRVNSCGEALMASRDHAARIVRSEPDQADGEGSAEAPAAVLADQLRSHVAEESRRRPGEAPAVDKPAPAPPARVAPATAAKPGKKRFMLIGLLALLALAGVS